MRNWRAETAAITWDVGRKSPGQNNYVQVTLGSKLLFAKECLRPAIAVNGVEGDTLVFPLYSILK